jgi:SAM-dependent methyltransferase
MCTSCAPAIDTTRTDAFSQKLISSLNGAAVMLMTSIGHRTGLFDVMAAANDNDNGTGQRNGWLTSHELAARANLSERYVREWLGAMTTSQVVEHRAIDGTYHLPPEHAALLTRAASPNNFAATAQWVAVLGGVEDHVTRAFGHGKGVPYSAYNRFHEVMAEESAQTTVAGLFEHILPIVPGLVDRLEKGIDVLDVGCGSGRAICALAGRFPRSRFFGYDFSGEAIDFARNEAKARELTNATFEARDCAEFIGRGQFELVTAFDAIHDQARPDRVLRNIATALKPDGTFLMQDIMASSQVAGNLDHALGPFLYTISCMHCMSVSLSNGGPGLGAAWGKELALRMLSDAGFGETSVQTLPHDIINYYYVSSARA